MRQWSKEVCAISGISLDGLFFHNNQKDIDCLKMKLSLAGLLYNLIYNGYRQFIVSSSSGVSLWAIGLLLEMKRSYSDVVLKIVVPYQDCEATWTSRQQECYRRYQEQADEVILLQRYRTSRCLQECDQFLSRYARIFVVVDNMLQPKTDIARYAIEKKKPVCFLDPFSLEISLYKSQGRRNIPTGKREDIIRFLTKK